MGKLSEIVSGIKEKLSGKENFDVEEYLDTLEDQEIAEEEAERYVKSMELGSLMDVQAIEDELAAGNIVLLDIGKLAKESPMKLKQAVGEIKEYVAQQNGDVARITENRLLLTPSDIKIQKRK